MESVQPNTYSGSIFVVGSHPYLQTDLQILALDIHLGKLRHLQDDPSSDTENTSVHPGSVTS